MLTPKSYAYKVKAIDNQNKSSVFSDEDKIWGYVDPCSGEGDNFTNSNEKIIIDFKLSNNYPNPFNPSTDIKFSIPQNQFVKLIIYSITGEEVTTLVNDFKTAGEYSVRFDGSNLASGIYIYKIEAGSFTASKKMLLIK